MRGSKKNSQSSKLPKPRNHHFGVKFSKRLKTFILQRIYPQCKRGEKAFLVNTQSWRVFLGTVCLENVDFTILQFFISSEFEVSKTHSLADMEFTRFAARETHAERARTQTTCKGEEIVLNFPLNSST